MGERLNTFKNMKLKHKSKTCGELLVYWNIISKLIEGNIGFAKCKKCL